MLHHLQVYKPFLRNFLRYVSHTRERERERESQAGKEGRTQGGKEVRRGGKENGSRRGREPSIVTIMIMCWSMNYNDEMTVMRKSIIEAFVDLVDIRFVTSRYRDQQ
jgi:hypothetical protein